MNSYVLSFYYSRSFNGVWNKVMMLMEKMMIVMKVRSFVMVFRIIYLVGEIRGGMGVRLDCYGCICMF